MPALHRGEACPAPRPGKKTHPVTGDKVSVPRPALCNFSLAPKKNDIVSRIADSLEEESARMAYDVQKAGEPPAAWTERRPLAAGEIAREQPISR